MQANLGIAIGSIAIKIKLKPYVYNLHFFYDSTDVVKKWQENRSAQDFFFFAHQRTFTRQSSLYPFLVHKHFEKKTVKQIGHPLKYYS